MTYSPTDSATDRVLRLKTGQLYRQMAEGLKRTNPPEFVPAPLRPIVESEVARLAELADMHLAELAADLVADGQRFWGPDCREGCGAPAADLAGQCLRCSGR